MDDLAAYAGMFWSAFLAATILPGASEVLLVALLVGGTGEPWIVIAVATIGNTLGSVTNWACGRFLCHYRDRRWFPVSAARSTVSPASFGAMGWCRFCSPGRPSIGDALTVIAGTLRVPLMPFTFVVGAGKLGRYLVVAGSTLSLGFYFKA